MGVESPCYGPKQVLDEYIVEPAAIPWRQGRIAGITFKCQILSRGAEGGPEALRFRFDPCPSVFAHMHLTSQFQLLLHGRMDFPKSAMKLRGIAVHYTDHNLPYGPFAVADDHDMLVLHPKQGGLISMADHDARRQINLRGRQLHGAASDTEWIHLPGFENVRSKPLISPASGPYAVMIECPPRAVVTLPNAPYGRYEVVLAGSAWVSGRELLAPGLRYVPGHKRVVSLEAGPDGATLMLLAFDQDAREGGLTGEGLSVAAAAAMERAI
ncbi:MAG: hypothetical protein ACLQBA_07740 [Candidatus Binataceae bacterium]